MKTFPSFALIGLACLLALLLAGCLGGSVDAAHQAAARRIGVVSALGDEAHGHLAGLPALLLAGQTHGSSADFGIDAAASAEAVKRLHAAYPGSAVMDLQAERDSVRLPAARRPGLFTGANIGERRRAMAEAARRIAARHALNLVVMIVPWEGNDGGAAQAADEPGYGFRTVSLFGAHIGDAGVFANFAVAAFDGGTGRHDVAEDVPQRESMAAYSPAERAKLAETIRGIVVKGVDEQLENMHLTP